MCAFEPLFHDADLGYVLRCRDCSHLQIAFGNVVLTLQEIDFPSFAGWLREIEAGQPVNEDILLKNILLPSPCEGLRLMFSLAELRKLNRMIDLADTEMQSRSILRLFQ
ncbi:DUF6686 family protein [Flavihumibacter petaseus]|uniref:Uncharacterized protein n=1 Tax=Flavihumibacter petaseus NBRC 106054 TaxID=1220578 RepID=A0A0E9MXN0_9BACT|nr:DUF6686 family protein [Flavihumibacter petaseus]GAO42467.1 hypothetical protein FPE01S_01_14815 [Flavihumibacter petaseus NBRC 106054]